MQRQTSTETLSDVRGHEVETQHPVSGSLSFSVSIEDDKGNIIMVRRLEDTANTSTPTSDIEISEESGRMVLTWQGQGKAKGFILHRAERGKDNYAPVSNLIPYFGRNDKDIFLYRFTDNSARPGVILTCLGMSWPLESPLSYLKIYMKVRAKFQCDTKMIMSSSTKIEMSY